MDATKRRGLGKGLAALLPTAAPRPAPPSSPAAAVDARAAEPEPAPQGYFLCDIDHIRPNATQPRRHFPEPDLAALAESIAEQGVIQPVVVRRLPADPAAAAGGARYELIAGERRWRAARQAGLERVPAVVREATDRGALEMALVENLQREDLNPLEVAEAYRTLAEEFALTQEAIARRVGRQRSTVANHLRLLRLPDEVKQALESGAVTMGHARAVLGLEDAALEVTAFKKVLAGKLSVRETERLVQHLREASARGGARRADRDAQAVERALARIGERLQRALGTKVEVRARGSRGRIVISYFSNEELDRLLERLEREH